MPPRLSTPFLVAPEIPAVLACLPATQLMKLLLESFQTPSESLPSSPFLAGLYEVEGEGVLSSVSSEFDRISRMAERFADFVDNEFRSANSRIRQCSIRLGEGKDVRGYQSVITIQSLP